MSRNSKLEIVFNIIGFSIGYLTCKSLFDWKVNSSSKFEDLQRSLKKADQAIDESKRLEEQ